MLFLLKCCFTSTETVGLLGTGAQDVHVDFHTAPELTCVLRQLLFQQLCSTNYVTMPVSEKQLLGDELVVGVIPSLMCHSYHPSHVGAQLRAAAGRALEVT